MKGRHYLYYHFVLPNFYFHLTTAYAILRSCGVDLGKRDYVGPHSNSDDLSWPGASCPVPSTSGESGVEVGLAYRGLKRFWRPGLETGCQKAAI